MVSCKIHPHIHEAFPCSACLNTLERFGLEERGIISIQDDGSTVKWRAALMDAMKDEITE